MCVQACVFDALTYVEREEEVEEEEVKREDLEIGIESLMQKHGSQAIIDTLARLQKD